MDAVADLNSQLTAMLMGSVFEPYASDYSSKLIEGRYAAATIRVYARCVGHFARWLAAERLGLEGINEETGRRFVTEHLPRCDCPPPVRRSPRDIKAALSHLYDVLRARGALVAPPGPADHLRSEIAAFDHYMDAVCGLAAKTRRQRVLLLTRFLTTRFGSGPIVAPEITAADLRQFVLGPKSAAPRGMGLARVMGGALRCYLQFRALAGDSVELLSGTIPRPANTLCANDDETLAPCEFRLGRRRTASWLCPIFIRSWMPRRAPALRKAAGRRSCPRQPRPRRNCQCGRSAGSSRPL